MRSCLVSALACGSLWMLFCWPCIDCSCSCFCKTNTHPDPTSTSQAWTVSVSSSLSPSCIPAFCALPRLDCHTSTNAGSFQRDSEFGGSHGTATASVTMSRRVSSTFSGPVRRCWVAGIVSFHSQLRGLWSKSLIWLPRKVRITKPQTGIEPVPYPHLRVALPFSELLRHMVSRRKEVTAGRRDRREEKRENGKAQEYSGLYSYALIFSYIQDLSHKTL